MDSGRRKEEGVQRRSLARDYNAHGQDRVQNRIYSLLHSQDMITQAGIRNKQVAASNPTPFPLIPSSVLCAPAATTHSTSSSSRKV